MFVVYVVVIVVTARHHEMFRDEVRALSIAREGDSFLAMVRNLHEGHPVLWYLLLRAAYNVFGSPLVLPVLSGIIAAAAVALMLRYSPLAPGQKALLSFGVFFIYEYSVMSRNYGLGVLILFIMAATYSWRFAHPIRWGLLLALLANTSLHAAVLMLALLAAWMWESVSSRPTSSGVPERSITRPGVLVGAAIAIAGLIVCAIVVRPEAGTNAAQRASSMPTMAKGLTASVLNPGAAFGDQLMPIPSGVWFGVSSHSIAVVATNVFFLLVAMGFWRRWPLLIAYIASLTGLGVIFRVGLPGELRHVGLMFMMIVFLYWRALIDSAHAKKGQPDLRSGHLFYTLTVPLTLVMVLHVALGVRKVSVDIQYPLSSNKAFGTFLRQPYYERAILIGEPDNLLESLPYYAPNRLYYPHRRSFGTHATLSKSLLGSLSLFQLLSIADSLRTATGDPVLIALDPRVEANDSGEVVGGKAKRFTWTPAERAIFFARTRRIARFLDSIDERYSVYEVLPASTEQPKSEDVASQLVWRLWVRCLMLSRRPRAAFAGSAHALPAVLMGREGCAIRV